MGNKIFNSISVKKPRSNKFDLSHEKKLSMNMGELVPIYLQEVIPGDKFRGEHEVFMRLAPMVAPMMHRVNAYVHTFFVPNRLVMDDWEDFITGGVDGLDATNLPKLVVRDANKSNFAIGTLSDYFGIPITPPTTMGVHAHALNSLPFKAYQLIYNEYFRDQTLDAEVDINTTSANLEGNDVIPLTTLRTRRFEKDYFTSALPNAQRGAEVTIPIDASFTPEYLTQAQTIPESPVSPDPLKTDTAGNIKGSITETVFGIDNLESNQDIDTVNITINEFRIATRVQEWLEKMSRAGSRYREQIYAFFNVKGKDSRLQRPEYLGGDRNPVMISEVLNTSDTVNAPQGEMSGHGIVAGKNKGFNKSIDEHGFIISILSVIPKTTYQQGLDRIWKKFDKFDYFWGPFAHLGEQEVLNQEIYQSWSESDLGENANTFGYQSRYAEYKYQQSSVHGDFRESLGYWHLGRIFASRPALNSTFLQADAEHRIFAVTDPTIDKLYVQIYNRIDALRAMPIYGTPSL